MSAPATPVSQKDADALRARIRGTLLLPGDAGYDDARTVWNGMIDRRPGAILRCLGTSDIVEGIRAARELALPLSIKGGGHNISGLAVADGALTLDLGMMRGVWVDPARKVVQAQAGCLLGDVDRETQLHGLAAVLGFVSATGIAGLTLGGGFGYLTRRFGWTCDTVRSIGMVTAEGKLVRASAESHPDLFWGLRGGGGNFGVATDFEYDLFPVGPEIMAGAVAWRGEDAPKVLEMFRQVAAEAPPELAIVAALRNAPPAPWLPKEIHGKPIIALFVCYTGPLDQAEAAVKPLKTFGAPVGDILMRRSYCSQQSILDPTQPKGRRYYWKSEYLPRVEPGLLDVLLKHAARNTMPHHAIVVFPLGGVLNGLPADHSPMGNRDAQYVVNITAGWDPPADDAAQIAWARDCWEDVRPFSTGGTYLNFLTEDEGDERVRAALGANYARLGQVKAAWDPDNLFRINKNIAPRKA